MASNTVALEAIDQTAEPLCAKIALTEPAISISLAELCSDSEKDSKQNIPRRENSKLSRIARIGVDGGHPSQAVLASVDESPDKGVARNARIRG
jgi:hypothetical protein